jgi:hypothetical protein
VTLTEQKAHGRWVLHLLHAHTVARGGHLPTAGGPLSIEGRTIEVIEDLIPLHDVAVSVRLDRPVKRVTLEPQGQSQAFRMEGGRVHVTVESFSCHQMVVFHAS